MVGSLGNWSGFLVKKTRECELVGITTINEIYIYIIFNLRTAWFDFTSALSHLPEKM